MPTRRRDPDAPITARNGWPAHSAVTATLAAHRRRGLIAAGSLTRRYTHCTSPSCRCNAEPPRPHGPYWQWTAKVNGKTVTRRLTDAEAASTRNGSATTASYAPSSSSCARLPPKPPN